MESKCNIRGKGTLKIQSIYFVITILVSDTFNNIPELVSYRSLK